MNNILPTEHRTCDGHFLVPVQHAPIPSCSGPTKKGLLVKLSERQNHRCVYCGEGVVFWWECDDIVATWKRSLPINREGKQDPNAHREFQASCSRISNLAVFEYASENKQHFHEDNLVVTCQECKQYRTVRGVAISTKRFAAVRQNPYRWENLLRHYDKERLKKKKAKMPADPTAGTGFKLDNRMFEHVQTLLAIDLEWFEFYEKKILEVGLTRFTKSGKYIASQHIIIRDYLKVKNKKYVPNKKDHFRHGYSEIVRKNEAAQIVLEELSKVDGVVVHGGKQDLTALRYIGLPKISPDNVFDTQTLFSQLLGVRQRLSLGRVSEFLDFELIDAHNAGNDAYATAKSFIGLCDIIESGQKVAYKGRRKSGTLILDSIEITT